VGLSAVLLLLLLLMILIICIYLAAKDSCGQPTPSEPRTCSSSSAACGCFNMYNRISDLIARLTRTLRISVYKIMVSPVVGVDNFVDINLASQLTLLIIFLQVRASLERTMMMPASTSG
jgi:hypothetical protein